MTSPVNGRKAEASAEAADEQPNAPNPCQASSTTPSDENDNAGSVASISTTVKEPKPPPRIEGKILFFFFFRLTYLVKRS